MPNLYNYTFLPVITNASFPFVSARSTTFPPFFDLSQFDSYHAEEITGMLVGAPFLLFALLPCATLIQNRAATASKLVDMKLEGTRKLPDWICIGLLGSSAVSIIIVSFYFYIALRYLADFTLTLALLVILGFWQRLALQPGPAIKSAMYSISGIGLSAWSVGISVLLAAGVSNPFSTLNPHLFQLLIEYLRSL